MFDCIPLAMWRITYHIVNCPGRLASTSIDEEYYTIRVPNVRTCALATVVPCQALRQLKVSLCLHENGCARLSFAKKHYFLQSLRIRPDKRQLI